jgi:hypothetical protein
MSLLTEAQTAAIASRNPGLAISGNGLIFTVTEVRRCTPCKRAHRVDHECGADVGDLITLGVVPAGEVLELFRNENERTAPADSTGAADR